MQKNIIGEVLKTQGRTKTWLSEKIGINRQSIYKYCSNRHQPSVFTLKDIADLLEVKMDDLIR